MPPPLHACSSGNAEDKNSVQTFRNPLAGLESWRTPCSENKSRPAAALARENNHPSAREEKSKVTKCMDGRENFFSIFPAFSGSDGTSLFDALCKGRAPELKLFSFLPFSPIRKPLPLVAKAQTRARYAISNLSIRRLRA